MNTTLKSATASCEIKALGAELVQFRRTDTGMDYLWNADPAFWAISAPVLFPIVCAVNGGKIRWNGQSHDIGNHGFVRKDEFTLVEATGTKAVYRHQWNEKTLAQYPFRYALSLVYTLSGNALEVRECLRSWEHGRHETRERGTLPLTLDPPPGDGSDDWRRAVAQYLSLYTSDTLSIIPDTSGARQQELASVGSRLGVDLTPDRVALPDLALKRADMFDYDGKALGFLAYLDPRSGPVSLCIIAGEGGDAAPRVEHRRGMNIVYWSQAHHGFMLIGRAGADHLRALATVVADRFGGSSVRKAVDDHG